MRFYITSPTQFENYFSPKPCELFPIERSALDVAMKEHFFTVPFAALAKLDIQLVVYENEQTLEFRRDNIEIHDVSYEGDVIIAWIHFEGRDGGGGNTQQKVKAKIHLPEEAKLALLEMLKEIHIEARFRESLQEALQESHLDPRSINIQIQLAFQEANLDDVAIAARRAILLIERGLDPDTIKKRRENLELECRHALTELSDPE